MNWRRRMLNHPLCFLVLALSLSLALIPRLADGAPLASKPVASTDDLNQVMSAIEQKVVATRLEEMGLSQTEVAAKVQTLNDDELHRLASRADQLGAGGDAASAVAAVVIFVLLLILILELLGRRVISRP